QAARCPATASRRSEARAGTVGERRRDGKGGPGHRGVGARRVSLTEAVAATSRAAGAPLLPLADLPVLLAVLLRQLRLLVAQVDRAAADERMLDVCGHVERAAVGDEQRRVLADRERAEPVADAEDLRRVARDRGERLLAIEAVRGGARGVVGEV